MTEDWFLTRTSNQSTDHMIKQLLPIIYENSQGDRGVAPHMDAMDVHVDPAGIYGRIIVTFNQ